MFVCSAAPPRVVDTTRSSSSDSSSDGPLLCQRVVVAAQPSSEVLLDPSSYGYQGCSCRPPFKAVSSSADSLRCALGSQVRTEVGALYNRVGGLCGQPCTHMTTSLCLRTIPNNCHTFSSLTHSLFLAGPTLESRAGTSASCLGPDAGCAGVCAVSLALPQLQGQR